MSSGNPPPPGQALELPSNRAGRPKIWPFRWNPVCLGVGEPERRASLALQPTPKPPQDSTPSPPSAFAFLFLSKGSIPVQQRIQKPQEYRSGGSPQSIRHAPTGLHIPAQGETLGIHAEQVPRSEGAPPSGCSSRVQGHSDGCVRSFRPQRMMGAEVPERCSGLVWGSPVGAGEVNRSPDSDESLVGAAVLCGTWASVTPTLPRLNLSHTPALPDTPATGPDPAQTVRQPSRIRWGRNGVHPGPQRVLPHPVMRGTASPTVVPCPLFSNLPPISSPCLRVTV